MNCPKCGQAAPDDARFCGKCGQQIDLRATAGATAGTAASMGDFGLATPSAVGAGAASGAGAAPYPGSPPFPGAQALPGLLERIKNILLTPKTEWPVIQAEATSVAELYRGYVMPMAAFAAVMSFVRMSVVGVELPFGGTIRTPIVSGLVSSVVTFVLGLIGLYLVGYIINMLAPTFAGARDQRQALKTAAYALTPAWIGTALTFLPLGALLQLIAGIYGIYVLYLGLPLMMRSDQEKAAGYTAAVVVCTILIGLLFGVVGAALGGAGRMAGLGGLNGAIYNSHRLDSRSPEAQAAAAERAGAMLGNAIGGVLGTDQKGKDGLANAFTNLARTGQQMEQEEARANAAARSSGAGSATGFDGADAAAAQAASAATASAGTAAGANANGSATTASAATGAAGTANATQNAVAATGALVSALGGALGGDVHHDPVDFNILKGMLPTSLPQMERTDAQGSSQQALGVKSSSATAQYRGAAEGSGGGSSSMQVKISDLSGVSGLLDAASGFVPTGETQTDAGFEKDMVVDGRMIHEKFDRRSGNGEVSAIVAKRFSVEVTGRGVDVAQLEKTLASVDLARLESMKDAGAHAR